MPSASEIPKKPNSGGDKKRNVDSPEMNEGALLAKDITDMRIISWLKDKHVSGMLARGCFYYTDDRQKPWCPLCLKPTQNVSSHMNAHFTIPRNVDRKAALKKIRRIIAKWKKNYFKSGIKSFMTRGELFKVCRGMPRDRVQETVNFLQKTFSGAPEPYIVTEGHMRLYGAGLNVPDED